MTSSGSNGTVCYFPLFVGVFVYHSDAPAANGRIKYFEATSLKASARGNHYRAIVKLIKFIRDSTATAFGIPRFKLTNDQDYWLQRVIDSWEPKCNETSQLAKREAVQYNTREQYEKNKHWSTVADLTTAANARILPILQRWSQQSELNEREQAKLLFFMIVIGRGGRGGSFAGAYV